MRVLYVSRAYTTHDRRFLSHIAAAHEVHFLRCESEDRGYETRPIPPGVRSVQQWEPVSGQMGPLDAVRAAPRFQSLLREIGPDLVHAGPVQGCGLMAVLAEACPLVLMSWGSDILVDADRDELWSWATRYALRRCDLLLSDSDAVTERARALAGLPSDRVLMFPWGIDLSAFSPGPDQVGVGDRSPTDDAIVVISTRSLEPLYRVELVVDAFARAAREEPKLRLIIAGEGSCAAEIDRRIAQHGIAGMVRRMGGVSNERLPDLFRAADIYVSASRSDGTSVSMLEAMATGLPVIVSDIPGNREWIRPGEHGWLVPGDDPEAFARAILRVSRLAADERARIARANRWLAELRAGEDTFGALLAAYDRLATGTTVGA